MKNAICVFFLSLAFIFTANSQTVTFKAQTFGFDVESGSNTGKTIEVDGKSYQVFKTAKGSEYIKSVGQKGQYPVWIGVESPTLKDENGKAIRLSKSGKAAVLYTKGNGYPGVRYLEFKVKN